MEIGKLNRRVTFLRRAAGQGAIGQPKTEWTSVSTVWASVLNLSGSAAIKANVDASTVKASIRTRWRTNITAGMRASCEGVVYDIQAVLPDLVGKQHVDYVCEVTK